MDNKNRRYSKQKIKYNNRKNKNGDNRKNKNNYNNNNQVNNLVFPCVIIDIVV